MSSKMEYSYDHIFIAYIALAKEGNNALGSVRLSVRFSSVCLCALSRLNLLTYDLPLWHGGRT